MVKKILNLILYSKDHIYDEMYTVLSKFYKRYPFVDSIFYVFDDSINTEYEYKNDLLKIKGKESLLPGVLDKTIKAFLWVHKNLSIHNYQYIVRSNISTIIEFSKFKKIIDENPFDYGSFLLLTLNWVDEYYGIVDKKYFGTKFASGTNIIFTTDIFLYIINNPNKLDYSIADDVAIGVLLQDVPNIVYSNFNIEHYYTFITEINKYIDFNNYFVFRNRTINRSADVERMKYIVSELTK
jgi:hypothetical protein